jgi:hydroxymethylbilane synthase
MKTFTLGTRGSALALAQAQLTRDALFRARPDLHLLQKVFLTRGDRKLDLSLIRANEAGGKGLFTRELEEALLDGTIEVAVHSLKDLPSQTPPGLDVIAVLPRAATADVLITREPWRIDTLPFNAVLGTSSIRRARQLHWLRGDLSIEEWRGNVQTRLRKLGEAPHVDGIVLAQAGLERLGFPLWNAAASVQPGNAQERRTANPFATLDFPPWTFHVSSLSGHLLPAIGQGAIALQGRSDRADVTAILRAIDDPETHLAIRAERALQKLLGGDCAMPVGAKTIIAGDRLTLRAILFRDNEPEPRTAEAYGAVDAPEAIAAEVFGLLQSPNSDL